MKNIIKNSILVLFLMVGMLGTGVNFAFAAQPTGSVSVDVTSSTTVVLHGSVNPNGTDTTAWFETMSGGPFQTQILGNGTTAIDMLPYTLTGLTPGQTYQARVYAGNADGILFTSWTSFTMPGIPASAPTITPTFSNVTTTSVTLRGTVNPNGADTTAWFETMSGGPFQTQNLGSGTIDTAMLPYTLTGLTPNTTYQFRVYAGNSIAPVFSDWVSFTTQSSGNGNSCSNGPTITSLSPDEVNEGAAATVVTVNGTNFVSGTTEVLVNGTNRTINSITSTSLTITLSAAELASNGNISITVQNGSCSNVATFTVNNVGGGNSGGGSGGGSSNTYPTVVTVSSTNITGTSATLNGTVDPNDHSTTAWFEYGTSSTLSTNTETTHVDMGSSNSVENLIKNITGLTANTTYYFRAVAENTHGIKKGDIESFTTSENVNGIITTIQATSQLTTSAKLNGLFINQTGESVQGYFEYGKTSALNSSTTPISLGTGASLSFSKTITSLTPDTIYYFRAVAKRDNTTYKGNVLVFKTKKVVTPTEPTTPTTTNNNSVVVEPVEETNIASSIFTITTAEEMTEVGKEIEYTLTYQNNSAKNLNNAVITVQLPDSVNFVASDLGVAGENNTVVFNLGTLAPSQTGTMKIIAKVNEKANDQNVIVTTAIMSYTPEGSDFQKDEIAYVTNKVNPVNDLGAASIWGYKSFLPSTLLGWLAVILVALGFIIVGKNLYAAYAYKRSEKQYDDVEDVELDNID